MSKKRGRLSSKQKIRQLENELRTYRNREKSLEKREKYLNEQELLLEERKKEIPADLPVSIVISQKNEDIISSLNKIDENLTHTKLLYRELKELKRKDYREIVAKLTRIHRKFYKKDEYKAMIDDIEELCEELGLTKIIPVCGELFNGSVHEKRNFSSQTCIITECIAPGWLLQGNVILKSLVETKKL